MKDHELIKDMLDGKDEVILDILLICANKPVNYSNLNSFMMDDLWTAAKSFASARNHSEDAITAALTSLQGAKWSNANMPDLIGLSFIEPLQEGLSGSQLYYAREEHFQDLIYSLCKDRIEQSVHDTLGITVETKRERECQIARVYLQYLNDILFQNQSAAGISIDIDKFRHHYNSIYGAEMPATITEKLIIDVLQMSRLGYEYDYRFYPFWYTVRGDAGRKFRQMLSDSIAARIS